MSSTVIDVVREGLIDPTLYHKAIKDLRKLKGVAGNYLWVCKPPALPNSSDSECQQWIPLYLGKSVDLCDRLHDYVHKSFFGPAHELLKLAMALNLQRRGFSISIVVCQSSGDAKQCESQVLHDMDFPACDRENNGYRQPILPNGRSIEDYPVLPECSDANAKFHQTHNRLNASPRTRQICSNLGLEPDLDCGIMRLKLALCRACAGKARRTVTVWCSCGHVSPIVLGT